MKLHPLANAITLAALLSATSLSAIAADFPLGSVVEANQVVTKVLAVDAVEHQVVLEGPEGRKVFVQLTDQAKDLGNLKVGDKVKVDVIHSVAAHLDTTVDTSPPDSSETIGDVRATTDNPNPGGAAFRQAKVQLKITHINLKKNQVTFENPTGKSKIIDVVRPEIQAKLKDLKVGQSVGVTYTDILKVTSQR